MTFSDGPTPEPETSAAEQRLMQRGEIPGGFQCDAERAVYGIACELRNELAALRVEREALRDRLSGARTAAAYWQGRYREAANTRWCDRIPPGGEVCTSCGTPVESEPCPEHSPEAVIARLTARVAELAAERAEPMIARWDRTVVRDADGTTLCCIAAGGRPVAVVLDDELAEALGGQLLLPEGDGEVPDPRVTALETLVDDAAEFRVRRPHQPGVAQVPLVGRLDPLGSGLWCVEEGLSDRGVRRVRTADGWAMAGSLTHAETYCWLDAETALAEARRALGGGAS